MKQPVWTFCTNSFQFQMDSGSQPYFIRDKMYHKMFKIITEIFEASTKTFQKTIIININLINIYWPTFYCIFKKYGKQSIMVMQMSMDFYQIHWWKQTYFWYQAVSILKHDIFKDKFSIVLFFIVWIKINEFCSGQLLDETLNRMFCESFIRWPENSVYNTAITNNKL